MKRFDIVLMLLVAVLGSCKDDTNPPVLQMPKLTQTSVEASYHSAKVNHNVHFSNDNVDVYVYFTKDPSATNPEKGGEWKTYNHLVFEKAGDYTLYTNFVDLDDDTEYYYMYAYTSLFDVQCGGEKSAIYSQKLSFRTLKNGAPDVQTVKSGEVGFYTAIVQVQKVSDNADCAPTSWGVCYATHQNPTVNDNYLKSSYNENVGVLFTLSNLTPDKKYYFRAYGKNNYGTKYGEEMSFTTVSTSVMSVETQRPADKGSSYAILSGTVTSHASLIISEKGFYLSKTNLTPGESDTDIKCDVGGEGSYQVQASGLSSFTTYYVRAYAICQYGKLYGNTIAFTTEQ